MSLFSKTTWFRTKKAIIKLDSIEMWYRENGKTVVELKDGRKFTSSRSLKSIENSLKKNKQTIL